MQFKDIKEGYPVYILDKQEFKVTEHKVVTTNFPHFDMNAKTPNQMVVDLSIEDLKNPLVVPDASSIAYAGNLVVAINKEDLMNEVKAMVNQAKQHFAMNEYMQKILDESPTIMSELSPAYKEKAETEQRLSSIEKSVADMRSMFENFLKEFKS